MALGSEGPMARLRTPRMLRARWRVTPGMALSSPTGMTSRSTAKPSSLRAWALN